MKFVFDFDDVLFENTRLFKPHMFTCIQHAGVPRKDAEEYYKVVREKEFSLMDFIAYLFQKYNISLPAQTVYHEIMDQCPQFINIELVQYVKEFGRNNCYVATNGDRNFNHDKVFSSGINDLFEKVYIVPGTKKEVLVDICKDHPEETILFFDDKIKFIEDINLEECPNLKPYVYNKIDFKVQVGIS